jgi:hypothetical protein
VGHHVFGIGDRHLETILVYIQSTDPVPVGVFVLPEALYWLTVCVCIAARLGERHDVAHVPRGIGGSPSTTPPQASLPLPSPHLQGPLCSRPARVPNPLHPARPRAAAGRGRLARDGVIVKFAVLSTKSKPKRISVVGASGHTRA